MILNINLTAEHVRIDENSVKNADGSLALIADIPDPVVIEPWAVRQVPTPIHITGNRSIISLAYVQAGVLLSEQDGCHGQYLAIGDGHQRRVVVDVINRTSASLIVQPGQSVGVLVFREIAGEEAGDDTSSDSGETANALPLPIVFDPAHISPDMRPSYGTSGAAAFDLRADIASAVTLAPQQRHAITTGIRMAIPQGHEGQIRPRSGLALKHGIGITNSPATIDSDYRGEIVVVLQNHGSESFTIEPADRIAQMLIAPVTRVSMDYVDSLDETTRGEGGFGSTGRR